MRVRRPLVGARSCRDPDEALAVSRTQRICRLTNSNGKILETSRAYDAVVSNRLGQEDRSTSERPMLTVFADHQGQQFVVATGTIKDADHHQYDLSVGAESATPDLKLAYGISALVVVMMLLVLAWAVRGQTAD